MSVEEIMRCDGACGRELYDLPRRVPGGAERVISGRRTNGMTGGAIPDAEFDLCYQCALLAFGALTQARAVRTARGLPTGPVPPDPAILLP